MCNCINVDVGSYKNQMLLNTPQFIQNIGSVGCKELRTTTCIDKCIVDEIKYLWSLGIVTLGSCCGHNKADGNICVMDKDIPKMKKLGYKRCSKYDRFVSLGYREDIWYSKTCIHKAMEV